MTRPETAVLEDVLDGYISVQTAKEDYGVIVTPGGEIDSAATAQQRSAASK
jgi:N-methylhydantoinase B